MAGPEPKLRELFSKALECQTPEKQAAFLDQACQRDVGLRARLVELLQAHREAGGFLEEPSEFRAATVEAPPAREQAGAVIGPYKLLEPIGEGGMGTVWTAQQQEPVKRLVAVKLIKAGMDSKQVIARFEAERQALALMDHANIARVLDGGTSSAGRPYFVMDLVKGVPITRYCDEHRLTPRQRLELFLPVCQAVQHAHQKGIIHRDLKPSNVLVALYDGVPVPKVIDFGVAKAAGQPLTEQTLVTGFGALVGTLEYMSPEQAEFNQLDVDTRSDIYSLGVLLYELLAGSPPFHRQEQQAGVLEMLRVIREQEPTRPSAKLSTAEGLPTLAANRGTEPAKLTRLVRGELDWIVMKALEKDRNRRYETASGFALDVQRYLADEPVLACPPSTAYRLKKFLRRNKGPVLAVAVVLLTLVGGIVGTAVGLVHAQAAREAEAERAEGERLAKERAETDFALANEAVEKYLGTVTNDPALKRADFHRLRKRLLESAIPFFQQLTAQKGDDPEVEARRGRAYYRLGLVRQAMGENEAALQDLEAARATFARLDADFPTVPAHRHVLAQSLTSSGYSRYHLGKRNEAEAVYRQAQDILEKLATDFPAEPQYRSSLANIYDHLGTVLCDLGKSEEGEALFRQAVAIGKKLTAESPLVRKYRQDLAGSHHNLGNLLHGQVGKHDEAETAYRQALDIQAKLAAEYPAEPQYRQDLAASHNQLANWLADLGKSEKAEEHYGQAVAIQEKLAAEFPSVPEFRQDLAMSYNNRGNLLNFLGRHEDAVAAFGQAVAIQEKLAAGFPTVPAYRQTLASGQNDLAHALLNLGRRPEAEAAYRRAIAIQEGLAAQFPAVAAHAVNLGGSYCNFGHLFHDSGQSEAALGWYRKAIATLEPVAAKEPRLADARDFLRNSHWGRAMAFDALGRPAEATRDWERALDLDDGSCGAMFRLRIFRNKKDATGCLAATAEYEALKRTDPEWLYDVACNRAICAAVIREDPKTPGPEAPRLAREQADLAMAWLHKAVAAGCKDAEQMKQDKNLDALRGREDFKKLLAELEANKK
jgi:serine/threonine protein kinase